MRESLNRDLFEQLVAAIAESRKRSVDEVRTLIDDGPFLPEDAVRVGLVDDLAYEDQLDDKVEARRVARRAPGSAATPIAASAWNRSGWAADRASRSSTSSA